ncbi:MAG TPA: transcriptional regulator, partial [Pirellulales bacterium]|nr:transcriptional regulator [Pirellulales bacterium]
MKTAAVKVLNDWLKNLEMVAVIHRFGPFQLDSEKRRLSRGREPVPLTPKALETLLVLVGRPGEVVEKDDLFKAVWPDTFVEEATLAQNIATIRKALGDTTETPTYVATVPRRGYRFLGPVTTAIGSERATSAPTLPTSRGGAWAAAMLAMGLIASLAWLLLRIPPLVQLPVAFSIQPTTGTQFSTSGAFMSVAPDGHAIAFIASTAAGEPSIWIREL